MNDIQEIMKNLEMIEKKKRKKQMKDIFIGVLPKKIIIKQRNINL